MKESSEASNADIVIHKWCSCACPSVLVCLPACTYLSVCLQTPADCLTTLSCQLYVYKSYSLGDHDAMTMEWNVITHQYICDVSPYQRTHPLHAS